MTRAARSGFTMVEILMVIAIIGILASLLVPNLMQTRARAYDTQSLGCARSLHIKAVEVHLEDPHQPYPQAADLVGSIRACDDEQLTVTTLDAEVQGYEYTVKHAQGVRTIHVTQQRLSAEDH